MSADQVKTLYVSSKCMVTAYNEAGTPIEEYTGPLSEIGPKLVSELDIPYEKLAEQGDLSRFIPS